MRNLLIFITKYNAFFLFLIFEVWAIVIYVKYNSFQKATFLNSAGQVTGSVYSKMNELHGYLSLRDANVRLARENTMLRNNLKSSFYIDTLAKRKVTDTVYKQQYEYITARVINNSVNHRNNYITINRGANDGIGKGMGVISNEGVVGTVISVSAHFAVIQSLLHKDTRLSAMLADNNAIGSLIWGDDLNPRKALLVDVNNNIKPHIGEKVVTSGYSLFPTGILFGRISNPHAKTGGFFLNMEIDLSVDFSELRYVNVVVNKFATEQAVLEAQEKKDE